MPCPSRSVGVAAAALVLSLGLGGCGGGETVGEALGYERAGPDEMTVIKRPPLTVPPDYNLRPPRSNQPRSQSEAASTAARETLIGPSSTVAPEPSDGAGQASVDKANASERAKATLTGKEVAGAESAASAGQSALLDRTNRVEGNLEALTETRQENRVDGSLLRRLVTWKPAPRDPEADAAQASDDVVKIVRREQRPASVGVN